MSQRFISVTDADVAKLLCAGAIGVIPTDTVYGLVARAADPRAIERLYSVKKRTSQPGTIIAHSIADLARLGLNEFELDQAAAYWPDRVSVVIDAARVAPYLKQTRTSLAVRIPRDPLLQRLLECTGPLMTTSANKPGCPTSTTIAAAEAYFGDEIDFYVDSGHIDGDRPSKIVGFDTNGDVTVFRP